MAVFCPLKVVITNLTDLHVRACACLYTVYHVSILLSLKEVQVAVPNIPHIPSKGDHYVPFVPSEVYIDAADFREVQM